LILLQRSVPAGLSVWMQKIVGLTLIALGAYVLRAVVVGAGPVGRGGAFLVLVDRIRHRGKGVQTSATSTYGPKSSLGLGVLHGVGAETPTQLSVLLIAANMGGLGNGVLALLMFAAGMFASNMALTTAATGTFEISRRNPWIFRWLGGLTSIYSLWIGVRLMVR